MRDKMFLLHFINCEIVITPPLLLCSLHMICSWLSFTCPKSKSGGNRWWSISSDSLFTLCFTHVIVVLHTIHSLLFLFHTRLTLHDESEALRRLANRLAPYWLVWYAAVFSVSRAHDSKVTSIMFILIMHNPSVLYNWDGFTSDESHIAHIVFRCLAMRLSIKYELLPGFFSPLLTHTMVKVYTGWMSRVSQPVSISEVKCAVEGGGKQPVETCCLGILT